MRPERDIDESHEPAPAGGSRPAGPKSPSELGLRWGPVAPLLHAEGLLLTAPRAEDEWGLLELDRDTETAYWLGYEPWRARIDTCRARIERSVRSWRSGERASFAVRERVDGELVGTVEATVSRGRVELVWVTHPRARRRGVATRAARAIIAYCLAHGATTVWASIDAENTASLRVARRAGMVENDRDGRWVHMVALAAAPA